MPITDKQVEWALGILVDKDGIAAAARAAHDHISDMDKVVLAKLMMDAPDEHKSAAAREMWARSHDTYVHHLEQKKAIAEMDYRAREKRTAASAVIEAWRTEQSNARLSGKIG